MPQLSHALDPHVASFRISSLMHVRRPFDCIEAALVRTYGDGMKKCGSGANLPSQMPRAYGHIFPCARTHGKWLDTPRGGGASRSRDHRQKEEKPPCRAQMEDKATLLRQRPPKNSRPSPSRRRRCWRRVRGGGITSVCEERRGGAGGRAEGARRHDAERSNKQATTSERASERASEQASDRARDGS